jgi:hypothetical protein
VFTETITRFLIHHIGQAAYFGFVGALLLAAPLALFWMAVTPLINGRTRGARYGLAVGIAVAIWASLCYLCVPYIGLYPNLPGAAFCLLVGADDPWIGELCIHGTNVVLWPVLGWLGFGFRQAANNRSLASN